MGIYDNIALLCLAENFRQMGGEEIAACNQIFQYISGTYRWQSIILMFIFIIIPIGTVFRMAFSEVSRIGKIKGFAGFENFVDVVNNAEFGRVLQNTIVWTILR